MTGCHPSNPLDRRVDASDPGIFSDWWKHEQPHLPPEIVIELSDAFTVLENASPRLQEVDLNDSNDPFCRKVNGLKIRDVLIDAAMAQDRLLLANISRETSNLEKLVSGGSDQATGNASSRRDWVIKQDQEMITAWKAQLEKNHARIAQLSAPIAR